MIFKTDLESNLNRVHEWIKTADQKVSIFLGFQGVVLSILFPQAFTWFIHSWKLLPIMLNSILLLGIVIVAYSIYKSAMAIIPRLNKKDRKISLTYFGDIANMNPSEFKQAIVQLNETEYCDELIEQIHISSTIAQKKHIEFRKALILFMVGISLCTLTYLIFRICYAN